MNVLLPPAELVSVGPPDWLRGYADSPALAAWLALPPGGQSTIAQRNAIVAQLAWCLSFLARPTQIVRSVGGVPFPYGVTPNGSSLVLGAVDYVPGDVTLPTAVRAAGSLPPPTPPTPPTPPAPLPPTITVTDAQRRAAFDAANGLLHGLALRPGSVLVPTAAPSTFAPGGYVQVAVGVAVVGLAIYAGYSAYVDAAAADAAARVQQTRIQEEERGRVIRDQTRIIEEGNTQRVTAQLQAKLSAMAQRLAYAKETGTMPPESALEREPIQVQAQQQLYQWQANAGKDPERSSSLAAIAAGALFGGAVVGVGTAAWGRREDIQLAYGAWRERRSGGQTT